MSETNILTHVSDAGDLVPAVGDFAGDTLAVPNGTSVTMIALDDKATNLSVEDYVQRYCGLLFRSAAFFVNAAHTVVHAKQNLRPADFNRFCDAVQLDRESSTYRKVFKIGEEFTRFEPVMEKLPNKWTTIYRLARIKPEEFARVLNSNKLRPFITDDEISDILNVAPKAKKGAKVVLDLSGLGDGAKQNLIQELRALKDRFGFNCDAINEGNA